MAAEEVSALSISMIRRLYRSMLSKYHLRYRGRWSLVDQDNVRVSGLREGEGVIRRRGDGRTKYG